MRQTLLTTVGALLFSTGLFAADAQLMNLVMPDAQVMAGMNVTTAKTSPFGQFLLTQLAAQGSESFEKLAATTGFDPRRDLVEVLAASPGNAGQKTGLVLARGVFNVEQLTAALAASGHGAQVSTYKGATLVTGADGKHTGSVAFLGTSVAIAGDEASVKAALDRAGQTNTVSAALAAKVQSLSASQDAWAVTLEPISALAPKSDAAATGPAAQAVQFLKAILAANGGVKFGGANVALTAQAIASDAKNAGALADVVRMVAGLVASQGQKDPTVAQILQTLQVSTDGDVVNISVSLPESTAEQFLKGMGAGQAQAKTGKGH